MRIYKLTSGAPSRQLMTARRKKIKTPLVKWRLIPMAGAGVGSSQPGLAVPTPSGEHSQLTLGTLAP